MELHRNLKPEKLAVRRRRKKIKELQKELAQNKKERRDVTDELSINYMTIDGHERVGDKRILHWSELERRLELFMIGWLEYISQEAQMLKEAEELTQKAKAVAEAFKKHILGSFNLPGSEVLVL
jgi:hypothetical protein